MKNNIKELMDKEFESNGRRVKISKIYRVNKGEVKDIYSFTVATSTLSTFNSLLNNEDLNKAVNDAIEEVRGNSKFISLLETFTPRVWLSISSSALGLKGYVSQDLETKKYGPIDFLNLGNVTRGM